MATEKDSDKSNLLNFLFPLVGALWACATINLNVTHYLNDIRNVVLTGELGSSNVKWHHAKLMVESDWFSMYMFIVAVDIAFGLLVLFSPFLINSEKRKPVIWQLCFLVSIIPISMGVLWLWYGYKDYVILACAVESADLYANLALENCKSGFNFVTQ